MIRTYFGLSQKPFTTGPDTPLLKHQQRHFDILQVHNQQGGLCLIFGDPGTGKTVLKNAIIHHNPKQWITPVINRSLHTWHNILHLLCQALALETDGNDHKCEARLIAQARILNQKGKQLIPINRSCEGILRAVKNLCISAMIEAVRDGTKTIDTKQINAVLLQPHWRHNLTNEPREALVFTNRKPAS